MFQRLRFWEKWRYTPFWIRLLHWEYWPWYAIHYPVLPYLIWLMARSRQITFFTGANPGIFTGGFGFESKFQTLQKIPADIRPNSILVAAGLPFDEVQSMLAAAGIHYPLIAKPDLGFRGFLVKKIHTPQELAQYLSAYPIDFIVQELLDYPCEVGVLYYRLPGENSGNITSITLKEFLQITGDGSSTVLELIKRHPRALLQMERLRDTHAHLFDEIPSAGQGISLGMVGNHAKGTKFVDGRHLINAEMVAGFDALSRQLDEIYYGRFDLKCNSPADLLTGQVKVIELNGVCSEPTHIYDPAHRYLPALFEVARHWKIIHRIAMANRKRGRRGMPAVQLAKTMWRARSYFKRVKMWAAASTAPAPGHLAQMPGSPPHTGGG